MPYEKAGGSPLLAQTQDISPAGISQSSPRTRFLHGLRTAERRAAEGERPRGEDPHLFLRVDFLPTEKPRHAARIELEVALNPE